MAALLGLIAANAIAVVAAALARPGAHLVPGDDRVAIVEQQQRLRRLVWLAGAQVAVVVVVVAGSLVSHLQDVADRRAWRGASYEEGGGNYYAYRDAGITLLLGSVVPICCALYLGRVRRRLGEPSTSA